MDHIQKPNYGPVRFFDFFQTSECTNNKAIYQFVQLFLKEKELSFIFDFFYTTSSNYKQV